MKIPFPSREFDDAVAAVCHGSASGEQIRGLNELLRNDAAARDEYVLRLELHSRLASDRDLFAELAEPIASPENFLRLGTVRKVRTRQTTWVLALAACLLLLGIGWWVLRLSQPGERPGATSKAVAMLSHVVDAEWNSADQAPRLGAPLEPGWLRLKSGLAQIVFYSGARVVIEGPAEFQIVTPGESSFRNGKLIAEVPPQARGFRVTTPQMSVIDLGTAFGIDVKQRRTELHVFKGSVELQATRGVAKQTLKEGAGAVTEDSRTLKLITADQKPFASLFDLQLKSTATGVLRHEQWRAAAVRLNEDPSLLVHFDFEQMDPAEWRLRNASSRKDAASDGTIVGCQWNEGRWPDKKALEFRNVNDRVRIDVPGEHESLTLAAWVRVQGLDRQINSLYMSDGFEPGTVHWSIRHDGVLALTAIGSEPRDHQICISPPVLTLNQFGLWVHLAAVIDGSAKDVVHYLNGVPVSHHVLNIKPTFRIGMAELGNWNAKGFPKEDPFMIRNFGGAIDEFCLFGRALSAEEIHALYSTGKPQPDPLIQTRN